MIGSDLPRGGIIVPLISPLPGTATRRIANGQFVVAVGAVSMLRFRISTATKQRAGKIRGGMHHAAKQVVDAVLWDHARDRLWRSRLGARDHQGRLHRSAFGAVRAGRRRQPEADAVHHRLHQRQGRRARQEVRTGSVRQQVAAVRRADRAQERDRPEHALHHAVQRLQHRRRPDRRRQQAQRAQPGQPHHLSELRRGGHRAHQRAVQLLAFPLRPARRHEGRGDGPRAAQGRDQGLPDQPGLSVRPVGAARREDLSSPSCGPTFRSSATS